MPKPEQIQSAELRALLQEAHQALRRGDTTTAVRRCAEAFLKLAARYPQVLEIPQGMRVHPWPRLGAMLVVEGGSPRIEFERESFSLSEGITYYEYTLGAILRAEQRAAQAAGQPMPS
ncbi:MAG: hypothetical protein C4290_10515 [Chloroflexota bacterium]|mgnify:CR=1 FL=1